jgi:hypothetical protein
MPIRKLLKRKQRLHIPRVRLDKCRNSRTRPRVLSYFGYITQEYRMSSVAGSLMSGEKAVFEPATARLAKRYFVDYLFS